MRFDTLDMTFSMITEEFIGVLSVIVTFSMSSGTYMRMTLVRAATERRNVWLLASWYVRSVRTFRIPNGCALHCLDKNTV